MLKHNILAKINRCFTDYATIVVVDPLTFRLVAETVLPFENNVVDVALKRHTDGRDFLMFSQSVAGIGVYTFDGLNFYSRQVPIIEWTMKIRSDA